MATTRNVYQEEVFNFLKTVTIKFDPMRGMLSDALLNNVDSTLNVDKVNYYYQRLMGNYIPGDTEMYVNSIDTNTQILFNKENLYNHPRTAAIYKIPNIEYDTLCKKYPTQKDLIKSIVYPVKDISLLQNSSKIAYISGDTSLLQVNEVAEIESAIRRYCEVLEGRWWVKEYCYEEGYPVAFYAMMWQLLPLICFTRRMTCIKTYATHPNHIWEYLTSKGLADYRDTLSIKQSLFLYRNMDYILANKGTADNLLVLSDNVLSDFSLTLFGKHIYQQQITKEEECLRTPEVVSVPIVSYETSSFDVQNSFESISTINSRMYQKGIERINTISYTTALEEAYGNVEEDRVPTKLVELKKDPVSTAYKNLYIQFIMETLIYRLSNNNMSFEISFVDPVVGTNMKMDVVDAFLILYYAIHRSSGTVPIYTPKFGAVRIPYKMKQPAVTDVAKTIWINDYPYATANYVNIPQIIHDIPWVNTPITSRVDFNNLINDQFEVMAMHTKTVENNADLTYHKSMMCVYNAMCASGNYEKALTPYPTYDAYFNSSETLMAIYSAYKDQSQVDYFDVLALTVFSAIVDTDSEMFKQVVGILESYSSIFAKMTSLLVQLASHNITFLGTTREMSDYLYVTPFILHADLIHGSSNGVIDANTLIKYGMHDVTMTFNDIDVSMSCDTQYDTINTYETITPVDIDMQQVAFGVTEDTSRLSVETTVTYE